MRIAVFGAGALGSVIGAILSHKNDVLLITRGEHLKRIKERGLVVKGLTDGTYRLNAESYYPGGYDLIILTVKAYQTEDALREIKREYSGEPLITFQNGVGVVNTLTDFDIIPGVTSHGATLLEPGTVMHAGYGDTYIGEKDGRITERVLTIAKNFTECGLKTEVVNDIMERRWIKAAVNACINPLATVLNVPNGVLVEDENLKEIMRCIANECSSVLAEKGINADIFSLAIDVAKKTGKNICSMLQDVRRGRKTEVDYIVKPFLFTQNSCLAVLYHLVKFRESTKRNAGRGIRTPAGNSPMA